MNLLLNKQKALKALFALLFVLLFSYFAWDMSTRIRDSFVFQGYSMAVNELITRAEDPQCQSFPVHFGEKNIQLINIQCLEQSQGKPEATVPEVQK